MKSLLYIGAGVGGAAGGWLGSLLDHNNFGIWSIIGSTIGGLAGLWLGYKLATRW